jgi:ubiquitin-activating enzyme E1 C
MATAGVEAILSSSGPFCNEYFVAGPEGLAAFQAKKILVVGAGGLGCEVLKSLALTGFRNIDVIDLDTIDISNLNRQFLFRRKDVGRPKAEVAAEFIRRRVPGVTITPHFCDLTTLSDEFYSQFDVVIGGLDSLTARRLICGRLVDIARNSGGECVIPYIDGGTEGWDGHVKFVVPMESACINCQLAMFAPQVEIGVCTIAVRPRQPEHCVIWAREIEWPRLRRDEPIDGDNDEHVDWLLARALEHAARFQIEGVDHRLAKGVVKNIIPAIASTQAVVAAMCATEALKWVTGTGPSISNSLRYAAENGMNCGHFFVEKNPNCQSCGRKIVPIPAVEGETVQQLLERLEKDFAYPANGLRVGDVVVYKSFIAGTHANLGKPLAEFAANDVVLAATAPGKDTMEFYFT